jgi:hypothetical protein
MQSGTRELTRDMPSSIARQASREVVAGVGTSVRQSVAEVLRPAEASAQSLLRAMEAASTTYQRAAHDAVMNCVIFSCVSSAGAAILVIMTMWMLRIL